MPPTERFDPASRPATAKLPPANPPDAVRDQLERLDDAMFDAIDGNAEALRRAENLWNAAAEELDWQLVEESREQYLRYAVDVTRRLEFDADSSPERALQALDVIALLTKN